MLLLISTHVVKDLEFLKNEDDKVHQISNVEKWTTMVALFADALKAGITNGSGNSGSWLDIYRLLTLVNSIIVIM
jgi:hypothetical protein